MWFNLIACICNSNGIDYSDMIARKQELGYTGPGYSKKLLTNLAWYILTNV